MADIENGEGAVNPYAAIAAPYLRKFHKTRVEKCAGTPLERAFNKLSAPEKKAVFVLGNAKAEIWPGKMAKLGHNQIAFEYSQFSEQEKLTLISGMKSLKELSDKIPYSRPGEEGAARLTEHDGSDGEESEETPISCVTNVTEPPDVHLNVLGF